MIKSIAPFVVGATVVTATTACVTAYALKPWFSGWYRHIRYVGGPLTYRGEVGSLRWWWRRFWSPLTYEQQELADRLYVEYSTQEIDFPAYEKEKLKVSDLEDQLVAAEAALAKLEDRSHSTEKHELFDAQLGAARQRVALIADRLDIAQAAIIHDHPRVMDEVDFDHPGPCVIAAAHYAWTKFPEPLDTPAQRLAIKHTIRRYMEDRNMRPSKIRRGLPIAFALVYLPTAEDYFASHLHEGWLASQALERMGGDSPPIH